MHVYTYTFARGEISTAPPVLATRVHSRLSAAFDSVLPKINLLQKLINFRFAKRRRASVKSIRLSRGALDGHLLPSPPVAICLRSFQFRTEPLRTRGNVIPHPLQLA